MKRNTFGKILSILLAVVMLASMLPATLLTASAEDAVAVKEIITFDDVKTSTGFASMSEYNTNGNPNWAYFGHTSVSGGMKGSWGQTTDPSKPDYRNEGKPYMRLRHPTADQKIWVAFKVKPQTALTEGKYAFNLDMVQLYPYDSGSTHNTSIYVAKYDSAKTTAAEYMTDANRICTDKKPSKSTGIAKMGEFDIFDPKASDEYVVIVEYKNGEMYIGGFEFERIADFPTSEDFEFKNSGSSSKDPKTYETIGADNPNWIFFDRDDAWDNGTIDLTTSNTTRMYIGANDLFYFRAKKAGEASTYTTWYAFKYQLQYADYLKPGKYNLTATITDNYPYNEAGANSSYNYSFFFAPYVEGQDEGSYYMTDANCVWNNQRFTTGNSEHIIASVTIEDTSVPYILVMKNHGANVVFKKFSLVRTGDLAKVNGVSLDQEAVTLDPGEKATLKATVVPEDAMDDKSVTWKSSNEGVATVANGVVTAVAPGTATITATTVSGGFTATCAVTVNDYQTEEKFSFKTNVTGKIFGGNFDEYGKSGNPNWKYFDAADFLKNNTDGVLDPVAGNMNGSNIRMAAYRNGKKFTYSPWFAVKVQITENIQPGTYKLGINAIDNSVNTGARVTAYVAEYDPAITNAEDYAKRENIAMTGNTAMAKAQYNYGDKDFVIADTSKEYVVIFRLGSTGTLRYGQEFWVSDFTFTRTGDVPEASAPVAEAVTYDFRVSSFPEFGEGWYAHRFNEYVFTARDWKFFDATQALIDNLNNGHSRFGRTLDGHYEIDLRPTEEEEKAFEVLEGYHSFKLAAPKAAGFYELSINSSGSSHGTDPTADRNQLYLAPYTSGTGASYKTDANHISTNAKWNTGSVVADKYVYLDGSADELIFVNNVGGYYKKVAYNTMTLTPVEAASSEVILSSEAIMAGEKANANLSINGKKVTPATVEFSSSANTIAQVNESGLITAVKPGTATITVKAGDVTASKVITVLEDELLSGNASVYAYSLVDGAAGAEGITSEKLTAGVVGSVAVGTNVKVTAAETIGDAKFSHWMTNGGKFLSDALEYTFKAYTGTAVVAVYETEEIEDDDVTVSFYNDFGGLLARATKATGTAFSEFAEAVATGSYRAYTITGWKGVKGDFKGSEEITKDTTAVATYDAYTQYTVTIDGVEEDYDYNAPVKATSDAENFSYWTRDGKIVSYNKEYNFYAWNDTEIASVKNGATTAKVAVALFNEGDDYMVEYDLPTGYTFVEAGIVGHSTGTPVVGGFEEKASSKKDLGLHGQFTAKCELSNVRGYVIYKNTAGKLVVSYAD